MMKKEAKYSHSDRMKNSSEYDPGKMYYYYTEHMFLSDLLDALDSSKSPGQRGAFTAAAIKKYKQEAMFALLFYISERENLDLTPPMAHKLLKELYNRSVSRPEMNIRFGLSNRGAGERSKDHTEERIGQLTEKYKGDAEEQMLTVESEIIVMLAKRDAIKR